MPNNWNAYAGGNYTAALTTKFYTYVVRIFEFYAHFQRDCTSYLKHERIDLFPNIQIAQGLTVNCWLQQDVQESHFPLHTNDIIDIIVTAHLISSITR